MQQRRYDQTLQIWGLNFSAAGSLILYLNTIFRSALHSGGGGAAKSTVAIVLGSEEGRCSWSAASNRWRLMPWLRLKCSIWAQKHQQRLEREYINNIKEGMCLCARNSDAVTFARTRQKSPSEQQRYRANLQQHAGFVDRLQTAD